MIDMTDVRMQSSEEVMLDYGVFQKTTLGGPISRVDRLGGGFGYRFSTPPMPVEPDSRIFTARCHMAKRKGIIVRLPQPGLIIGAPGASITVQGASTGGEEVAITGAAAGYVVRQHQALNITKNGHRYLYFAAASVTLNGSGAGTVLLTTPLRTKLAGAEAINLAAPVIEGWMQGDNFTRAIPVDRKVVLQFDVLERA
ncbi:hypothetical protein SAMN05518849_101537 [Sphingobium sp. AP50]|uniref:hypothetical protein n=1 Tax=Sphingobium sp. AP50 TaxID=1884369 RepID=UPI0008B7BAE7|nr:hypothetical protein [Sphingobium sp. AP50]SEI68055.1 hypothetical protein SAMN05518849_101537 [Sphingobium sp. AP50]